MVKTVQISRLITLEPSGAVAHYLERPICPGGCGFYPQLSHTKDFKNGISCPLRSALQRNSGWFGVSIMLLDEMSGHVSKV